MIQVHLARMIYQSVEKIKVRAQNPFFHAFFTNRLCFRLLLFNPYFLPKLSSIKLSVTVLYALTPFCFLICYISVDSLFNNWVNGSARLDVPTWRADGRLSLTPAPLCISRAMAALFILSEKNCYQHTVIVNLQKLKQIKVLSLVMTKITFSLS